MIDVAGRGEIASVLSEAVISQVRRALLWLGFPADAAADVEREMRAVSVVVNPAFRLGVIAAKESDNRALECAVTRGAEVIVSGDRKHLLKLRSYEASRSAHRSIFSPCH